MSSFVLAILACLCTCVTGVTYPILRGLYFDDMLPYWKSVDCNQFTYDDVKCVFGKELPFSRRGKVALCRQLRAEALAFTSELCDRSTFELDGFEQRAGSFLPKFTNNPVDADENFLHNFAIRIMERNKDHIQKNERMNRKLANKPFNFLGQLEWKLEEQKDQMIFINMFRSSAIALQKFHERSGLLLLDIKPGNFISAKSFEDVSNRPGTEFDSFIKDLRLSLFPEEFQRSKRIPVHARIFPSIAPELRDYVTLSSVTTSSPPTKQPRLSIDIATTSSPPAKKPRLATTSSLPANEPVFANKAPITPAATVYGLGFYMKFFCDEERDGVQLIEHEDGYFPSVLQMRKRARFCEEGLVDIIKKCMEEDPTKRYESPGVLAETLTKRLLVMQQRNATPMPVHESGNVETDLGR